MSTLQQLVSTVDLQSDEQTFSAESFQKHLSLLSLLLKDDHDAAVELLRGGGVGEAGFAEFVKHERLQSFIFSIMNRSPVRSLLTREWLEELKVFSLSKWVRQEHLV